MYFISHSPRICYFMEKKPKKKKRAGSDSLIFYQNRMEISVWLNTVAQIRQSRIIEENTMELT